MNQNQKRKEGKAEASKNKLETLPKKKSRVNRSLVFIDCLLPFSFLFFGTKAVSKPANSVRLGPVSHDTRIPDIFSLKYINITINVISEPETMFVGLPQ